ncbi:MAG: head-tail adaptor protein [Roseovarius sp.]
MAQVTLNHPLVLEAAQRSPDGAGGFLESWTVLGTLWAERKAGSGNEAQGAGVSLSRTRFKITVRAAPLGAPSRPKPEHRFRDGTRIFRILSVAESDVSARYLTCLTTEEVAV